MNIIVTKDNVKIAEQDLVHKGEYNVNPLIFSFSEEYEGISKMAVFSTPLKVYETAIVSNSCIIPHEVLTQKGVLKIGVYGYTLDNGVVNKRYSPTPIQIPINDGSYIKGASDPQAENPSEFEEFMQQLEDDIDSINDDINVLGQSVEDLQENKQDKIDGDNKLPSDLVSDENQTNKFVTAEEKTAWNNKSDFSGDYNDLTNKPTIPTKVSELTNDSNYQTYEDVEDMISALGSVFVLKGSVNTVADLPMQDNKLGDVYYVKSESAGYVWIEDEGIERWEELGLTIDTSDFLTKSELLQTTGVATDNAMSQVGVTNALNTKQNTIDSNNKLSADLVNDSNTTNKFVTSAEKTTWNNKSDFTGNYNDLTNKPDLTIYEEKTEAQAKYEDLQAENEALLSQIPTNEVSGTTINVQDSSNLPIKDFAMIGNATQADTPTPSTPQDIHVVTGDNTLEVVGKNLFDKATKADYYNSTSTGLEITGDVLSLHILSSGQTYVMQKVQKHFGNKLYAISFIASKINSRAFVRLRNKSDTGWLTNQDVSIANWNYNSYYNGWYKDISTTSCNLSVEIPDCLYWQFGVGYANTSVNVGDIETISKVQIETNTTTPTTYSPYTEQTQLLSLGSIELAKIGDYTDRIFKAVSSNNPLKPSYYDTLPSEVKASLTVGSWYKQGNIDKYTFTGSENFLSAAVGTNSWSLGSTISTIYDTAKTLIISNIFRGISNDKRQTGGDNTIYFGSASTFYIRNTTYTTKAQIQQATQGKYVLYVTATPTYTEITDTTLIGQLENILAMHTNKNVTNAWIEPSGTNAQGGMVLVYRQDLQTITDKIDSLEARVSLLE